MKLRSNIRGPLLAAGLASMMAVCGLAQAQVLEKTPDKTIAVFEVKNLEQTSKKAAKMAKDLGLDQLDPDLADPLGTLEEKAHMGKGVDQSGDMALALVDPSEAGGDSDKSVVMLVPVKDYKAFLGNFKSTAEDGDVTKATPVEGDEVYVAEWGKYAAISPVKALVAKKPEHGIKLEGPLAKQVESQDAVLLANMPVIREKYLGDFTKNRKEIADKLTEQMSGAGDSAKQLAPLLKVIINGYLDMGERVLKDSNGASLGMTITDDGIRMTGMGDFTAQSPSAEVVKSIKNTDDSMLAGLPDRKYFMYGGGVSDPASSSKMVKQILDPLRDEIAKSDETKQFVPVIDAILKMAPAVKGSAVGLVAPSGQLGAESFIQEILVVHGDAAVIKEGQRKVLETSNTLMSGITGQSQLKTKTTVELNAKTVDGVSLDEMKTTMEPKDPNDPVAAQMKEIMSKMYGPNGLTGVMGEVNGDTMFSGYCLPDALLADAIAAAKNNTDALGKRDVVKAVAAALPKERAAVIYFDLDTLLDTAVRAAKDAGLPINVKMPQDLPPIGMTMGSEDTAVRFDVFIPSTLVQGLVSTGMQAYQQQQRGGGGI